MNADTPLTTELVTSEVVRPLFVTAAPGDNDRLFIVEKGGQIRVMLDGELLPDPFLDVSALARTNGFEQGLLGLAFHPNYAGDPKEPGFGTFFVNYTNLVEDTVVARYSVSADPNVANPNGHQVLSFTQPQNNHNGGWMAFGPDGYLYISSGDGGGSYDDDSGHTDGMGNGQDTSKLLGKLLRIDVDVDDFPGDDTRDYAIPPTNPFVGVEGADEIWAYGLRNPWRCAFDAATGDLYIADVGQDEVEEINFQPAASTGGENYGWRCMEGPECTGLTGCTCMDDALTDPIHSYNHPALGGCRSITGGEVYRGTAIPDLAGTYFFADYCSNAIWSLRYDGSTVSDFRERTCELGPQGNLRITSISSFGHGAAGEVYICDLFGGEVYKIVPAAGIVESAPPDGAIDARQPSKPDGSDPTGWTSIELTFDIGLGCMTKDDFAISQQGGKGPAPGVASITLLSADRVRVDFDGRIEPKAWTTIEHLPSGRSVRLGYLPGDVSGDGLVSSDDILALVYAIRNIGGPVAEWSLDIDRSGRFDHRELLPLIDLLVGAATFDAYLGMSLPE